jgi:hypothetical protein
MLTSMKHPNTKRPSNNPEPQRDKLANLTRRDCLVGDPDIVHMDWSKEWRP